MEFLQGARKKKHMQDMRAFLRDLAFEVIPFSQNIGHRASIYVEQFTLSKGIRAGDAIIAATAVEHNLKLCTAYVKHFKDIPGLGLKTLKL